MSSSTTSSQSWSSRGVAASSTLRFSNLPGHLQERSESRRGGGSVSARLRMRCRESPTIRDARSPSTSTRARVAASCRAPEAPAPSRQHLEASRPRSAVARRRPSMSPTSPLSPERKSSGAAERSRGGTGGDRVRSPSRGAAGSTAFGRGRLASPQRFAQAPAAVGDHCQTGGTAAPHDVADTSGQRAQLTGERAALPRATRRSDGRPCRARGGPAQRAQTRIGGRSPVLQGGARHIEDHALVGVAVIAGRPRCASRSCHSCSSPPYSKRHVERSHAIEGGAANRHVGAPRKARGVSPGPRSREVIGAALAPAGSAAVSLPGGAGSGR